MHFLVSVVWDDEHRNTFAYEAETAEAACAALLEEFHITRQDVVSLEASPEGGKRVQESNVQQQ